MTEAKLEKTLVFIFKWGFYLFIGFWLVLEVLALLLLPMAFHFNPH